MRQNLRGEMTLVAVQQFKAEPSSKLIADVMTLLRSENISDVFAGSPTKREGVDSQQVLIPMLLNHSARYNDLEGIKALLVEYDALINVGDYHGKVFLISSGVERCLLDRLHFMYRLRKVMLLL
jgi:hypothetical protein